MTRRIALILRQILFCGFVTYSLNCFSQEFITKIPLNKQTNYAVETQLAYQIFDEKNKLLQLFLIDDYQISGVLLNDSFETKKTIVVNEKKNVFKNFSGGSIRENSTNLYFTGKSDEKITIVSLNFDSETHSLSSIELDMKGEMSLNMFEIKEGILLLTIVKGTSKLKLYKIVGNALSDVITFDFTDKEKYFGDNATLHKCLVKGFIKKLPDFKIISSKNPNPLELTSSLVKIYFENEQIYFTIDEDDFKSIVIRLDHATKQKELLTFMKNLMGCNHQTYYRAGNSLIFEGKLCQVFACSEQIGFRFIDMNTGKVLKEYFTQNKKEISFKNNAIEKNFPGFMVNQKKKEIENTEDFFKILSNKNAAISIYKINDDKLEITMGVYKEIQSSGHGGIAFGFPSGSFGTFGGGHYFPVFGSYQGYKNSKAVYFKSLINSITFEHVKDSLKPNIFDRVDTFLENAKKEMYKGFDIPINYDIIFKKDNIHYLGYLKNYQNYYFYRLKEDN